MLLIRPLLETNKEREFKVHTVVFFIFLVSNIGGCLLPIGDPPLFLGYLKQVPFLWTMKSLWFEWMVMNLFLLGVYFIWDSIVYKKEDLSHIVADETTRKPLKVEGTLNLLWLAGIVFCVATMDSTKPFLGTGWKPFPFMREICQLLFVGVAWFTTRARIRQENEFNFFPIAEVACLFIGIFVCMQVPIEILRIKGASLGLEDPWQFFWATGTLSSFLDNAPTYVVFFETAGTMTTHGEVLTGVLTATGEISVKILIAISLGAVFMGANTYIGNGPNFMVKSIAEQCGVQMPSFFGYMFKYSLPVLVPSFILFTFLFM